MTRSTSSQCAIESCIGFDAFAQQAAAFDAAVDISELPDPFCSSSEWIIPAQRVFGPLADSCIKRFDEGWMALMRLDTPLGRTLVPLEVSWCLASPFVGPEPSVITGKALRFLLQHRDAYDALFLSGLTRGSAEFSLAAHVLGRWFRLGLGRKTTVRCVASLEGGVDGFLSRRSRKFRKSLRGSLRRAEQAGVLLVDEAPSTPAQALDALRRILAVEAMSWKGKEGHGITIDTMQQFYEDMLARLASRGALRITFAWLDGRPIGFIFGGVRGRTYRGLQVSFLDEYVELGLGNVLQFHTIQALCREGRVNRYDLGTEMPYKARWAEERVETIALVAH